MTNDVRYMNVELDSPTAVQLDVGLRCSHRTRIISTYRTYQRLLRQLS